MASASVSLPDQTTLSATRSGTLKLSADRPIPTPQPPNLLAYFAGQKWRNKAICIDIPHFVFFPERGVTGEQVRDICFSCPVRLECLQDSVDAMPKFGWQGGHPKEGRTKIRRLLNLGYDLETADAVVLSDALGKVRQRKKEEKSRWFDQAIGEPIIGEHELVAS